MELSRPVVVQHHAHSTLPLDFQGQILKMLYLRNRRADWYGTKGIWVDRLTLNFQGQILKKSYLRNGMADWHGINGM